MSISAPFVRRPIATGLLAAALFLAGLVAFRFLPVAPLPRVDYPTIVVSASLPGASPETMASAVATPLERRFGRIAGVTEITSSSSLGSTSITLQFDLDRNVESAARDVQAAINAAGGELPPNLPNLPIYRKVNPSDSAIMILAVTSDTIATGPVADAVTTILAQRISRVEGVGQVTVGGAQQPAVRVRVDPRALAGVGLTMADVRNAIGRATAHSPKGVLSGDATAFAIGANDQLRGADAFRSILIGSSGDATIRLGDVADVDDSVENERVAAWSNGKPAILIIIRREPGANILETNERIKNLLPELTSSISPAIHVEVTLDRTQSIRASVDDVELTLVVSLVLVVLVVFAFLRSLRATVIPAVAVPLSLVGTFGVMYLLDYSLDNLSLMALTIATGFVVDDAIVVTENVARHLEMGKPPLQAALDGAKQIGFTIVSITVSLLAVFLPILLMGGIVGRIFREFAVTLAVAIAMSALISLTLTPAMCAHLLGRPTKAPNRLSRATERAFDAVQTGYERALVFVLRFRRVVLAITLLTVGLTVGLYVYVPKGLFPDQDIGSLRGGTQAPQDISFSAMKERQRAVLAVAESDPDVAHAVAFMGGGPGGGSTNAGFMFLELKSGKRASANAIIQRLRPKFAQIEGIRVFLQVAQDIRVGGRGTNAQYQYTLQDADLEELRTWAPRLLEALRKLPELKDVNTDQQDAGLSLQLEVDRDSASRLGVPMQDVDGALYDAFGQRQVATTFASMNQYRVVLEMKPALAGTIDAVDDLYVRAADGGLVPLQGLITTRIGATALSIAHQGQFPSTTISFNLAPNVSLGQAVAAVRRAELGIGMPASIRADFSGTAQAFKDSLSSEPYLVLAALVTVYIVLGMLYESTIHPITILSTLPSAGVGALLALLAFGVDLSVMALIGIILLIGIVKKNAIMMIDFAIEAERDEGLSPERAIVKACLQRFRPILMTTFAALFGAIPLAIGTGIGSEFRKPLGIAIVGGLLFSQALTLFTTPVVYLALDRFTKRNRQARAHAHAAP